MIDNFCGNPDVRETLAGMVSAQRIPQTLLLSGPPGVGKATLVRRFAAHLIGDAAKIEDDDLSREANRELLAEREKLPTDKRADDPLLFNSHPDFVTFCPEGPLRQISIQQVRLLKERAPFQPLKGRWRVFLVDQVDRANEQAANSLLKILEEPPPHLILFLTASNPYDLLPTIRSRAVSLPLRRVPEPDLRRFVEARGLDQAERRIAFAHGCPGLAITADLAIYDQRREAMLKLLEVGAGKAPFAEWVRFGESIGARKTEKLEEYLNVLYLLLEDLLLVQQGRGAHVNRDVERQLQGLTALVDFAWIQLATRQVDALVSLVRRNIHKSLALDALVMALRQRTPLA